MKNQNEKPSNSGRGTDANRDPITKAPGAHPVGTGVGAAVGGAATGAAIGAATGGPIGAAVGVVAGSIAGGLAGKGVAEKIDPTVEDRYWKEHYASCAYTDKGVAYDEYQPAYRTGYEGYSRYRGKRFNEVESDLKRDYERSKGGSKLSWDKAKLAVQDAWHRIEEKLPGDADRDGR